MASALTAFTRRVSAAAAATAEAEGAWWLSAEAEAPPAAVERFTSTMKLRAP
jgi:hypothetical protein